MSRLVLFLVLSLALHLLLLFVLGRLPPSAMKRLAKEQPLMVDLVPAEMAKPKELASRKEVKKEEKKEIKRFDMMEVKEGLSDEPGSLSKNNRPKTMMSAAPPQPAIVPPKPKPLAPPAKEERREAAKKKAVKERYRERPEGTEPTEQVREETPTQKESPRLPEEKPRELPSVKDLIPTLSQIYAMQSPGESLFQHPSIMQDGIGDQPARVAYDEYLAEFKSRVKLNWRVSEDRYMHESATVLLIVVSPEGTLKSLQKVKGSGMPEHDFEAVMAVRNSFPMRSPPDILLDEEGNLSINFTFYYHVRRDTRPPPTFRW